MNLSNRLKQRLVTRGSNNRLVPIFNKALLQLMQLEHYYYMLEILINFNNAIINYF